ncbi:MAG: tetratricopeptide repeat protein [Ignavibacteriaceae bacterium]|nr:tetratricopeptide repeat protein [Ignavibacteriaceae bacterium]
MQHSKLLIGIAFIIGMIFTGFQCSSTELTSAKLYIDQGNFEKALDMLQKDVEKNPQSDEGYFLMGHIYGEIDDLEKMISSFNNSLSISNKFATKIGEQKGFHWANKFNKGVNNFQRGNKVADPDSATIFYDRSIKFFKDAALIEPDSADNYRNISFVYLSAGRTEEAIDPLSKLVEMEKSEDGYQYLGDVYYTLGTNKNIDFKNNNNAQDSIDALAHFNSAIDVLEEGRKLYPENKEILVTLSESYVGANKIDVAMDAFKASVEADPNNQYFRYNYGVLLLNANRYEEAEEQFTKALEIDAEYENAIYNLGVTYVKWGTQMNDDAEEQGIISEDYKEKYELALPYLKRVVELDPTNGQMWEILGKVYSVLGMQDEAANAFDKADQLR